MVFVKRERKIIVHKAEGAPPRFRLCNAHGNAANTGVDSEVTCGRCLRMIEKWKRAHHEPAPAAEVAP